MAKFKSRYKNMPVGYKGSNIDFQNYEYITFNPNEIKYLKNLSSGDVICVSDKLVEQDIRALRVQARDLHFPNDVTKAKKDDLIQFIESKK